MRRCTVSVVGKDGERHSLEADANSLFDAAYKAVEQWGMLGGFFRCRQISKCGAEINADVLNRAM
jgi:hypothetical protein